MNDYSQDYSAYTYTTYDATTAGAMAAGISAGLLIFLFFAFLAVYALNAWLLGRIFKKAGQPSWIAWVPIYNNWKFLEIGGQQGFWAILMLIPFVNIAAAIFVLIAAYQIGLKLGKSGAFLLLAIFLPIVWTAILAFDSSTWEGQPTQAMPGTTPPTPPVPPTTPPQPPVGPSDPTPPAGPTPPTTPVV